MAVVISALLPVFLLIVLGFVLRRSLMRLDTQWHGLERLTYYVLFPTLLIQTLVKADLSSVWGILNAPATGEALAELIVDGRARSTDLSPFDPPRLNALDPTLLHLG